MIHNSLVKFADLLEMDFDRATKTDITMAWNVILSSDLSIKTKQDEYLHIRQVFKHWFGEDEVYPQVVRGMKRPKGRGPLMLPEELPSEDLIHRAIKACRNPRDRFFVAYEGLDAGARPVELRRLQWKHLKKDQHGYYFRLWTAKQSGDSDYRPIRVIYSVPYLLEWMKTYPGQRTDEAYVFCNLTDPQQAITHNALTRLFQRLKKLLGLSGKFSPYVLRHATLTRMGKNPRVPEAILKKFAGHTQSSRIIGAYQHYGGDDIKDMQLDYAGQSGRQDNTSHELKKKPVRCPHCHQDNPWDAEVCGFCQWALSPTRQVTYEDLRDQIEVLQEDRRKTHQLIQELIAKLPDSGHS